MVLDLEEKVAAAVQKLKERGLVSPYLRSFVVARINPLRWIEDEPPPLEDVLKTMRERAVKFNVEKVRPQDLAGAAGPPDETECCSPYGASAREGHYVARGCHVLLLMFDLVYLSITRNDSILLSLQPT
jgi:hypothetical protein